ncbi:MAG TPA: LysE family transporter [Chloroflexota bacterium]|jgi:threonine/homoserine/homoserine lactone efflux protein
MADVLAFVGGVAIGLSVAAPLGPIGILCVRRALAEGRLVGLVCGLGAAAADAVHGGVAVSGVAAIASILVGQQALLRLVGGLFLVYLGARTILAALLGPG